MTLRPLRVEDFEPSAAIMADTEAARFIAGPQVRTGAWHLQGFSIFSVIERATGR